MSDWWTDSPLATEEDLVPAGVGDAWWQITPLANAADLESHAALTQARARLAEEDASLFNAVAAGMSGGIHKADMVAAQAQLGANVLGPAARLVGAGQYADRMHRMGDAFAQAAGERDEQGVVPSVLKRAARGVATSLPPMIVGGRLGGTPGAVASAVIPEYSSAIEEGHRAGMSDQETLLYAAKQAAIEGGIATIFQMAGLGGLESTVGRAAVATGVRQAAKQAGVRTLQELPEEILTELHHNAARAVAGVEPGAASDKALAQAAFDASVQTLMTMGVAEAPGIIAARQGQKPAAAPPPPQPATPAPAPANATQPEPAPDVPAKEVIPNAEQTTEGADGELDDADRDELRASAERYGMVETWHLMSIRDKMKSWPPQSDSWLTNMQDARLALIEAELSKRAAGQTQPPTSSADTTPAAPTEAAQPGLAVEPEAIEQPEPTPPKRLGRSPGTPVKYASAEAGAMIPARYVTHNPDGSVKLQTRDGRRIDVLADDVDWVGGQEETVPDAASESPEAGMNSATVHDQGQTGEATPQSGGGAKYTRPTTPTAEAPEATAPPEPDVSKKPTPVTEQPPPAVNSGSFRVEPNAPAGPVEGEQPKRKFSSTQVNLPAGVASEVQKLGAKITDEDLAEDGREIEPHITVKYGLHNEFGGPVRKIVEGEPPIRVKFGKVSIFPAKEATAQRGGAQYDVVKIDIESEDLRRINKKIADALPHTDTHPTYQPHVTLAYVKPGQGSKYVGLNDMEGQEVLLDKLTFSGVSGQKVEIPLTGKRQLGGKPAPVQEKAREKTDAEAEVRPDTVSPESEAQPDARSPATRLAEAVKDRLMALRGSSKLSPDELFAMADAAFGGSRGEGKYGDSQAYDALESGVNQMIFDLIPTQRSAQGAKEVVKSIEGTSARVPSHKSRTGNKDNLQQFSTPPAYAYVANWAANVRPGDVVLEPSAGTGGLVVHALNDGADVYANEIDPARAELLRSLPVKQVFTEDAEHIDAILKDKMPAPTVIVMNPPFSRAGHRLGDKMVTGTDRKHIDAALGLLAPGGRLVAIVGAGLHGRGKGFDDWLSSIPYNVRADIEIVRDVYKGHGTTFPTRLLVIDNSPRTMKRPLSAQVETLPEAIDLLEGVRNERQEATGGQAVRGQGADQPQPQSAQPPRKKRLDDRSSGVQPGVPVQPATGDLATGEQPQPSAGTSQPVQQGTSGQRPVNAGLGASGTAGTAQPGIAGRPEPGDGIAGGQAGSTGKGKNRGKPGEPAGGQPVLEPSGASAEPAVGGEPVVPQVETEPAAKRAKKELGEATYEHYEPRVRIKGAKKHPASIVESAAMAAIDPPEIAYRPNLPEKLIRGYTLDDGTQVAISDLQLEAVAAAGQAHTQILPNGDRRGFMIGDGTGVGKAREIAGILLDNWNQGRRKSVWLSKNSSLLEPARDEWKKVGGDPDKVFSQSNIGSGQAIDAADGILFTTYSTLKGEASDQAKAVGNIKARLDQIVDWAGKDFDGVIVFDEAHMMGSALDRGRGFDKKAASQMALAGVDLQARLPKARVVYLSATSATEVENLAYAVRLGLWGEETAFPDRERFIDSISSGGVAAMEKVAADMKAMGMYLARNIAFDDGTEKGTVTYERLEHTLTPDQRSSYDKMAEAWAIVFRNMNEALELTGGKKNGMAVGKARGQFWSANQRFWNQVITAMQTPAVIRAIEKDIAEGRSSVVQLTNTNEASQKKALANRPVDEDGEDDLSQVDVSPKYILMDYIQRSFPTNKYEEYVDDAGNVRTRPAKDSKGNPVHDPLAVAAKNKLLEQLGSLQVANRGALDMILDHFGEDMVAEITGRGERLIEKGGKTIRQKRSPRARKADAGAFMDRKKRVLVFSEAGGTGASYHADLSRSNQDKRSHYLLQAGWRADAAIQGLGRSHRSNQAQAPHYILVHTDLKGQKRFISTIARRLAQLGALTKGARKAGESGVFKASDNLESTEARDALRQFYRDAVQNQIEGVDLNYLENTLGLTMRDKDGRLLSELPPITQFLNRVLSLPVDAQNRVFDEFQGRVDAIVEQAVASGTLDQGMETVKADRIEKLSEQTVFKHATGAEAKHVVVNLHRKTKPRTWEQAQNSKVLRFVKNGVSDKVFAVEETGTVEQDKHGRISKKVRLVGPIDTQYSTLDRIDGGRNWETLEDDDAQREWEQQYKDAPKTTATKMHLLSGVLLPIWDRMPEGTAQVKRLLTEDGEQILGRVIPGDEVQDVLKKLGVSMEAPKLSAQEAVDAVLRGGKLTLANEWKIKRSRVEGEALIELVGPNYAYDEELERQGVFKRRIQYNTRYFIPTGDKAAKVLGAVVRNHPITDVEGDDVQALRVTEPGTTKGVRQSRSTAAGSPEDAAGISAANIIKTWERIFGVPIRTGGFSRRAIGIYKVFPEVVRLREGHYANLAAAAHEVAHHIDKQTGISDTVSGGLANELAGLDYEPKGRVFEGFAEFIRHYITERDAEQVAPEFYKWFTDTWMPANPKLAAALGEAQTHARQFADQTVFQRVRALISDRIPHDLSAYRRWKRRVGTRASALTRHWLDRLAPLQWFDDEANRLDKDGKKDSLVYQTAMAYDMTANANAAQALEAGVHAITDGRLLGRSLWKLREQLKQGEYDEALAYAYALHALDRAEKRPGYNTGLDAEDAQRIVDEVRTDRSKQGRFDALADGIAEYNNALLDMLVDAGALSPAARDRMIEEYGNRYFPLHRVQDEESQRFAGEGARFMNLPKAVKGRSREGSGRQIIDPFDATVARTIYFYGRAAKARVAHALIQKADPKFGGVEGLGGLVDRVDPKRAATTGAIDEVLGQLVANSFVSEEDASAARVAAFLKGLPVRQPSDQANQDFAKRHSLKMADYGDASWLAAAEKEPDVLATISLWRPDFTPNGKKATVLYQDPEGNPHLYEIDRELYRTVTGMDEIQLPAFLKIFSGAAKVFKAGAVGLSSAFGVKNFVRDYMEYQGRASKVSGAESLGKPLEMTARYIGHKTRQLAGKEADDALLKTYEEFGGKLYNRLGNDIASRQRLRKRKLGKTNTESAFSIGSLYGSAKDKVANAVEAIQEAIALSDAPPRLAEMEAMGRKLGYERRGGKWYEIASGTEVSLPEAARIRMMNAAAEATINFKRVGEYGRGVNQFSSFFNATIQASVREARQVKTLRSLFRPRLTTEDGDEQAAALRYLVYLSAMASAGAVIAMLRGDDDDYREQEDWFRDNHWSWGKDGKTYFKMPKPRDLGGLVTNMTEQAIDAWYHGDREGVAGELLGATSRHLAGRVPDVGGGAVRGAVEAFVADYDYFRGKPLTPDYLKDEPEALRYTPYTTETAKAIGSVTGPALGLSPIQVEHILNQSSGGAYRRWAEAAEAAVAGELEPRHLPLVVAVVMNRHQAESLDDFYTAWEQVKEQVKLEEASGEIKPETASQKAKLDDYAAVMTAIRKADERDLRGRRKFMYEKYLVGLAREALGREPLESNPSPIAGYRNAPPQVQAAVDGFVVGSATDILAGKPKEVTPLEENRGLTLDDKVSQWEAAKVRAIEQLKDNKLGKETVQKAVGSWINAEIKGDDARVNKMRRFNEIMGWMQP